MGLGTLTFALVVARLLKLIEMVVNHGVGLGDVMGLIGYIMPGFLELSFPMAILLGVMLGFGRMSGDHELTAARACGIGLHRLAVPVLAMAVLAWGLSSLAYVRCASVGERQSAREVVSTDAHPTDGRAAGKNLQPELSRIGCVCRPDRA